MNKETYDKQVAEWATDAANQVQGYAEEEDTPVDEFIDDNESVIEEAVQGAALNPLDTLDLKEPEMVEVLYEDTYTGWSHLGEDIEWPMDREGELVTGRTDELSGFIRSVTKQVIRKDVEDEVRKQLNG